MKTIIIVRHAKSSWEYPDLDDLERPLNKRGKRDAPIMGNWIAKQSIHVDAMMCSPAQRSLSTAFSFASALQYPMNKLIVSASIYEVSADHLLYTMQDDFDNIWQTVVLFGHNYACTEFANWYTNRPIENVPTCGVVAIDFEVEDWSKTTKKNGVVRFFEYPKKQLS